METNLLEMALNIKAVMDAIKNDAVKRLSKKSSRKA